MATGRARQQRYRERRRQSGAKPYELWLDPDWQALVDTLQRSEESLSDLVGRALRTLTHETMAPSSGITSDILLLTFLRLFFPEDKPVYPRRAYGLRSLPLAALNMFLARHGFMLHAAKVRNRDWFVT